MRLQENSVYPLYLNQGQYSLDTRKKSLSTHCGAVSETMIEGQSSAGDKPGEAVGMRRRCQG